MIKLTQIYMYIEVLKLEDSSLLFALLCTSANMARRELRLLHFINIHLNHAISVVNSRNFLGYHYDLTPLSHGSCNKYYTVLSGKYVTLHVFPLGTDNETIMIHSLQVPQGEQCAIFPSNHVQYLNTIAPHDNTKC